ncbi:cytochrome c [Gemmatimonas sp.]|uniref:cytochrome c n=1 Tax=Gemmatimonas sp. TaxID=1962908 RepID=UPI00286E81FE|nr:cytochrome c [Gemmatimonas sp.]
MAPRDLVGRARGRLARFSALAGVALVCIATARYREPLIAQDTAPTFTKDVAPILYKNCTTCHRPGGLGPFSLVDYDSAKANVDDIRDAVRSGFMPPWHAEGPHGTFSNDRRLSDLEKSTVMRWIDAGAKKGDEKKAPAKPIYATGWEIGTPDAIVTMPEDFTVPASGTVEYQYFEIPTNFTEDKWVSAIEFMPGAREVVHHVLVYAKVPANPNAAPAAPRPAGTPAPRPLFVRKPQYDSPEDPPRQDLRHGPPRQLGVLIGSTAPGTNVMTLPAGTALRVRAGTVLTFQMHYTAHGHEMKDRTSVGFRFAPGMPDEEMRMGAYINGAFTLPAGQKDIAVTADLEPTEPIKLWGLLPHTHLRGTRWKYTLEKPDGTSQLVLDVPRYDFNWQTYYFFKNPIDIPAGGKLVSTAWYDNSATNKHNPDANKDVKWGDQTWEEMQYTGYMYTVPSRRLKPASK